MEWDRQHLARNWAAQARTSAHSSVCCGSRSQRKATRTSAACRPLPWRKSRCLDRVRTRRGLTKQVEMCGKQNWRIGRGREQRAQLFQCRNQSAQRFKAEIHAAPLRAFSAGFDRCFIPKELPSGPQCVAIDRVDVLERRLCDKDERRGIVRHSESARRPNRCRSASRLAHSVTRRRS